MDPPAEPLMQRLRGFLEPFAAEHGFAIDAGGDRASSLEAWVRLESPTIILDVVRDRGDEYVVVTARDRPGPRKPRRAWPLGQVVGYLDGAAVPYVAGLAVELEWLSRRAEEILDPAMLNSEDLRLWAVKASRRTFGQDRRG